VGLDEWKGLGTIMKLLFTCGEGFDAVDAERLV
jgi:hypothetical protein